MKMVTVDDIIRDARWVFNLLETFEVDGVINVRGEWFVNGERRETTCSIVKLYRDCGGCDPCAPCEGGLMVFDSICERDTWLNQK